MTERDTDPASSSYADTAPATLAPPDADLSPPRARQPLHWRMLQFASTYLPVMLMALLAIGTWWLVKNAVVPVDEPVAAAPRHEPDYVMNDFEVQRYNATGALEAQIEGDVLRHYPDTDALEIDRVRLRAIDAEGRTTIATARQAVTDSAATQVQLLGEADILREGTATEQPIHFRSEFLHAFLEEERVMSNKPVVVTQGSTVLRSDGMTYTHGDGVVRFQGRTRAVIEPRERKR